MKLLCVKVSYMTLLYVKFVCVVIVRERWYVTKLCVMCVSVCESIVCESIVCESIVCEIIVCYVSVCEVVCEVIVCESIVCDIIIC